MLKKFKRKAGQGDFYGGTCANLSGYEGDLDTVAKKVKECLKDIEEKDNKEEVVKAEELEQKRKLDNITKVTFNPKENKPQKVKNIDGTIVNKGSDKPPRKILEDCMISFLDGDSEKKVSLSEISKSGGLVNAYEAAKLAAIVPSPRYYDKHFDAEGLQRKAEFILSSMDKADIP